MSTPVCSISASGISRPTLADCLSYFVSAYQGVYGADVVVTADTQDGELLGLLASALSDVNQSCVQAYNSFSPATAQGAGLSSVVKINGLARDIPTKSTVPALIVGPQGTTIENGLAVDANNVQWSLPASVVIGATGQIAVTLTCATDGAIHIGSGQALTAVNPTRGWQSTTTTAAATPGAPVETDAQLRLRQSGSTQTPSLTMLGSIRGALLDIPSIGRLKIYQNETGSPDSNGIPGFSIAVVCDGGDATAIATAIQASKFACGTYGTTTRTIVDAIGVSHPINFFYTTDVDIICEVSILPAPTYSVNTESLIQKSIAYWVNNHNGIGNYLQLSRAWSAAYLSPMIDGTANALKDAIASGDASAIATYTARLANFYAISQTYEVTALTFGIKGGSLSAADVVIDFNEAASIACDATGLPVTLSDVTVTIVP